MISFACPCGKNFRFSEKFIGRAFRCNLCGRPLVVPAESELPGSTSAASATNGSVSQGAGSFSNAQSKSGSVEIITPVTPTLSIDIGALPTKLRSTATVAANTSASSLPEQQNEVGNVAPTSKKSTAKQEKVLPPSLPKLNLPSNTTVPSPNVTSSQSPLPPALQPTPSDIDLDEDTPISGTSIGHDDDTVGEFDDFISDGTLENNGQIKSEHPQYSQIPPTSKSISLNENIKQENADDSTTTVLSKAMISANAANSAENKAGKKIDPKKQKTDENSTKPAKKSFFSGLFSKKAKKDSKAVLTADAVQAAEEKTPAPKKAEKASKASKANNASSEKTTEKVESTDLTDKTAGSENGDASDKKKVKNQKSSDGSKAKSKIKFVWDILAPVIIVVLGVFCYMFWSGQTAEQEKVKKAESTANSLRSELNRLKNQDSPAKQPETQPEQAPVVQNTELPQNNSLPQNPVSAQSEVSKPEAEPLLELPVPASGQADPNLELLPEIELPQDKLVTEIVPDSID
ncbi:MAG: hypothetical protein ACRC2T_01990 [Thermoguttaceae bacterium]